MSRPILGGSTDVSTVIRIIDSTDGTPETGVTSATAGLALWYRREGASVVALTESDLAQTDSAHSDGGMIHLSDGYYRVDLPDAAVAAGVAGVMVGGTVTGMVVVGSCHPIDPPVDVRKVNGTAASVGTEPPTAEEIREEMDSNSTQLTAIAGDVAGLDGAAMRGTNNAALASVCTEARLAELDAANLPADVAAVKVDTAATLEDTGTTLPTAVAAVQTEVNKVPRTGETHTWTNTSTSETATVEITEP